MPIMKFTSVLATLCLVASSAAGGPSLVTLMRLTQEAPCKVCVLGTATTSYTPKPTCWQNTSFTSQSMVHGYCGPAPNCNSSACDFDVTITVTSSSTCNRFEIFRNLVSVASCTNCATLTWNSGTISLTCSPFNAFSNLFEVKVNNWLEHDKTFTCNICQ